MQTVRKKRRPIYVDPLLTEMLNLIALYEKKSVAEVCRPILAQPVRDRFDDLPDAIKQMAGQEIDADQQQPAA